MGQYIEMEASVNVAFEAEIAGKKVTSSGNEQEKPADQEERKSEK